MDELGGGECIGGGGEEGTQTLAVLLSSNSEDEITAACGAWGESTACPDG